MAYHDENGRITIDAAAAQKDIRRIREAIQVLEDSRSAICSLERQAGQMQGEVAFAIVHQAGRMKKSLENVIDKLEETIIFVQKTVRHYELLDEQIKQAIQAAADAAEAARAAAAVNVQNTKNSSAKSSSSAAAPAGTKHTGSSGGTATPDVSDILKGLGDAASSVFENFFGKK